MHVYVIRIRYVGLYSESDCFSLYVRAAKRRAGCKVIKPRCACTVRAYGSHSVCVCLFVTRISALPLHFG